MDHWFNSGATRLLHCLSWQPAPPTLPEKTAHFSLVLGMCQRGSRTQADSAREQMQGYGSGQVSLESLGSVPNQAGCLRFCENFAHLLLITKIQCHQKLDHMHCVWDRNQYCRMIGWVCCGEIMHSSAAQTSEAKTSPSGVKGNLLSSRNMHLGVLCHK